MFNVGILSQQGLPFISTWNTANTSVGSSTSTQIKLPLTSAGTYNFVVDWGDGSTDTITSWNQAETTHTYGSSGVKTIIIKGTIVGFRFSNTGDRLKITNISQWGVLRLGTSQGFYFHGSANLTITATDILDTSLITNLAGTFNECPAITTIPSINLWDVSKATSLNSTFRAATNFNSNIGNWDVSKVTDMTNLLIRATSFNQDVSSWDTSSVTNMQNAFNMQTSPVSPNNFNQNLGGWDVSKVTNMIAMLNGVTLSTANYDALLIGWESQDVRNNITFSGGNSKYSAGTATDARARLISDHNWTITDGGPE